MLANLSRARSSLLFGAGRGCFRGLFENEVDGRCGEDLEILGDDNKAVFVLTEGDDKFEEHD